MLEDHWSKTRTSRKNRRKGAAQGPFTENNLCREVGQSSFQKLKMINNLLSAEATHTKLDMFEKKPLLTNSPDGPKLEFEFLNDRNNFIDSPKLLLNIKEIKCKIPRNKDGDLRSTTDAANTDAP